MSGALSGIRVLEISQVLAAPFCGYQFALLGAEVIKVEIPDAPDCARGRGPRSDLNAKGTGLTYQVQGGNKQSLALDIRTEQGRTALLKLVKTTDVFLENYSTGVMAELGLSYDSLCQINPQIIYCSMTGYGAHGPKHSKGAYDNTVQAASGVIAQSGGIKPGVSFIDYAAGYSAAFAIAAALLQRQQTGKGCHISASMLEVALSLMAPEAAAIQATPETSKPAEAGIQQYDTADKPLMLGAFKPSQYRKLGAALETLGHSVPGLADIQDWQDVWHHSIRLKKQLQSIFLQRSAEEWLGILEAADIPAEPVVSLQEALNDKQLAERDYFVASPSDSSITLPLSAYQMSHGGPELHSSPPSLGQDNHAILQSAGFSPTDINALVATGVLACSA